MNWLEKRKAEKKRAELAIQIVRGMVLACPWITIGASRGLYICNDDDVFCRWCGCNIKEGHADDCSWFKACQEWAVDDPLYWQWSYWLEPYREPVDDPMQWLAYDEGGQG